jgi:serine O-acetyltransferase
MYDAQLQAVADQLAAAERNSHLPDCGAVVAILDDLRRLLFPVCFGREGDVISLLSQIESRLIQQIAAVLPPDNRAEELVRAFLLRLPAVQRTLLEDAEALFDGDPAARSREEVILAYPGLYAVFVYRVAHELHLLGIPLLPRILSEHAHSRTGIDIHPGAVIGPRFFIDHGTGVVIGETTTIGCSVKLYQHVTLGAKSFEVGEDGTLVKGIKRHPDIGDRVVIYAGATILGGETRIGNDCVIGGSVWLTHSVPAGKMVLARTAVTDTPLTRDIISNPILDCSML